MDLFKRVNCSRGAPMGRTGNPLYTDRPDSLEPYRFHLQNACLDSGGYDSGGAYWGLGDPVYGAYAPDADYLIYMRAESREAAKKQVREVFPNARFFN